MSVSETAISSMKVERGPFKTCLLDSCTDMLTERFCKLIISLLILPKSFCEIILSVYKIDVNKSFPQNVGKTDHQNILFERNKLH